GQVESSTINKVTAREWEEEEAPGRSEAPVATEESLKGAGHGAEGPGEQAGECVGQECSRGSYSPVHPQHNHTPHASCKVSSSIPSALAALWYTPDCRGATETRGGREAEREEKKT
ncbi:hypothetical protein INR49_032934, partial [Caranx melampygus]